MENSTLVIVIPTKNEGPNIRSMAEGLNETLHPNYIFVMDDSSTDDTELQCKLIRESGIPLEYVKRTANFGYGAATIDGMLKYVALEADWLLTIDGDGSHRVVDAVTVYQSRGPGITIGSRWTKGGKTPGWPLYRRVMSWCANTFASRVLSLNVRDKTNGFRVYDQQTVKTLLKNDLPVGYDFLLATLFIAKNSDIPIREIPTSFIQRTEGSSNLGMKQIFEWIHELRALRRGSASNAKH